MTDEQFREYVSTFKDLFMLTAPRDTGNLAFDSIRYVFTSPTRAVVYVDTKIAPYVPYTNEPWISPRWKGKKNPNEKWFERGVEDALRMTNRIMKARIKSKK